MRCGIVRGAWIAAVAVFAFVAVSEPTAAAEDKGGGIQQFFQGLLGPRQSSTPTAQPAASPARGLQQQPQQRQAASSAIAWVDDISGVANPVFDIADTLMAGQVVTLGPKGKAVIG
jgi:membrane protease subunit (stomatin/prohibitin family)